MRLFQIKNKYMYKCKNKKEENGTHMYAVYRDKKSGKYRAIQLTHLYEDNKAKAINKGYLKVEKFKQFKFPSGVHNSYYDRDINGKSLYFGKNTIHKKVGSINSNQAKRIKSFAKYKEK